MTCTGCTRHNIKMDCPVHGDLSVKNAVKTGSFDGPRGVESRRDVVFVGPWELMKS